MEILPLHCVQRQDDDGDRNRAMAVAPPPVRPVSIDEIRAARERIKIWRCTRR